MSKKSLRKIITVFFILLSLSCGLLFFISYSIVKKFIFRHQHTKQWIEQTKDHRTRLYQLGAMPVTFKAADGVALSGLLFVRPEATRTILMCHGYSRNKERLLHLIELFADDNIFIFDYRAHGESGGEYTTIGFYEKDDVIAAYKFLENNPHTQHLAVFGIGLSMGGVSLLGAAAQGIPFKAVVIDSAFTTLDEQIAYVFPQKTGLPRIPFMPLCRIIFEFLCRCSMHEVNPVQWAQKVTCPVLIIHSYDDDFVAVGAAYKIYNHLASKHKQLWIVEHALHAKAFKHYPLEYAKKVSAFFDGVKN